MPAPVVLQRAPGWMWRRFGGSVLVMGPERQALQLDGAAALVWLGLETPATIANAIAMEADHWADVTEPLPLAQDAADELCAAGIVVPVDGRDVAP